VFVAAAQCPDSLGPSKTNRLSTVIWKRADRLFCEISQLDRTPNGYRLSGLAVYRGRSGPTTMNYLIDTDAGWRTRQVALTLNEPGQLSELVLEADGAGSWQRAGSPLELDFGCDDVDLAISPSTNTLAIRRLDLSVGQSGSARVLWIQVPSFKMRAVEQTYERVSATSYRFKGRYGSYLIEVDNNGLVLDYPGGGWTAASHRLSARG
jgi:hypothetical protein